MSQRSMREAWTRMKRWALGSASSPTPGLSKVPHGKGTASESATPKCDVRKCAADKVAIHRALDQLVRRARAGWSHGAMVVAQGVGGMGRQTFARQTAALHTRWFDTEADAMKSAHDGHEVMVAALEKPATHTRRVEVEEVSWGAVQYRPRPGELGGGGECDDGARSSGPELGGGRSRSLRRSS